MTAIPIKLVDPKSIVSALAGVSEIVDMSRVIGPGTQKALGSYLNRLARVENEGMVQGIRGFVIEEGPSIAAGYVVAKGAGAVKNFVTENLKADWRLCKRALGTLENVGKWAIGR